MKDVKSLSKYESIIETDTEAVAGVKWRIWKAHAAFMSLSKFRKTKNIIPQTQIWQKLADVI